MWVLKLLWPGKPTLLVRQSNHHVDSFIKKKKTKKETIELYFHLWKLFLFSMNKDNSGNSIDLILVGKCPLSVIRL